jgi:hypothetical protein
LRENPIAENRDTEDGAAGKQGLYETAIPLKNTLRLRVFAVETAASEI